MSESSYYYYTPEGQPHNFPTPLEAITKAAEGGFVWLNFFQPAKEELLPLVKSLGIHPLSIEDCLDENQVPKMEHFLNNTFILFNAFSYIEKVLWIDEVNLFIGTNFLITVSGNHSNGRKPLNGFEKVIDNGSCPAKGGPAFLMHVILDYIVDQKFQAIETMEDELEESEEDLLNRPSGYDPTELVRIRRYLLNLRKSLFHEREILVKICRLDSPFIGEKAIFHYRDIYDHLAKFFEMTETNREIVTTLMELYTSLLNNLMTKASNETNASVRRLTLIATIFMPLTLIAGIGGMSEWTMMTGEANWKISYPVFLLGLTVIGIINYYLIRRLEKRNLQVLKD